MPQIRLLIADKDSMFLDKLSNYIYKNRGSNFLLELFTDPKKFEDWQRKNGKVDLIAVSSSFLYELSVKPDPINSIVLIDSPESLIPQEYNVINKYISAEKLIKEIISVIADKLELNSYKDKNDLGTVYLVLYADGSDFYNPLAQSIACIKAINGSSTFYLNLDELSHTDSYFTGSNEKGLSEMLYYIKTKKSNLILKSETCTSKDINFGLDFMKGHKNPDDIRNMTPDECILLIETIKERSCYENIIVSRAFTPDKTLSVLIKLAGKIYITSSNFYSSLERLNRISESLPDINEKVYYCINSICRMDKYYKIDNLRKVFLPDPYPGKCCFPPSNQYFTAVKSLLAQ
ncbi:MAG: hypothetical protein GX957_08760 [Clostridiaceae bacterium]|nr:hypothetical protein [Clostridiaceae bacterium]